MAIFSPDGSLGSISWTSSASTPPSTVTLDAGVQGNHTGSVLDPAFDD